MRITYDTHCNTICVYTLVIQDICTKDGNAFELEYEEPFVSKFLYWSMNNNRMYYSGSSSIRDNFMNNEIEQNIPFDPPSLRKPFS